MNAIWTDTAALPAFPPLDGDAQTDVLIIGGGMAGILCAYELANRGVDCMLIEADRLLCGTSGRTTAKLTVQHGLFADTLIREFGVESARLYMKANAAALERFRELCKEIDCDFEPRDAFVYLTDDAARIEAEMRALELLGCKATHVETLPLPFPVAGAIRMENQAQFHPVKFAAGIVPKLKIYEHTAAQAYDGHAVRTNRGKVTANRIIVTTHFPIFNKHGAYFLKLYQHRSYVLALSGVSDIHGMYVDGSGSGLSFRHAGDALLLGGGAHRTGKSGGGWAELSAFFHSHYPDAREIGRWAAQDCMTLDGIPYIGQYAGSTPDLYVAAGFNKWGMTGSMAAAMILCDLLCGKESPYAPVFSPSRTMLRKQLALNALEATASLLTPTAPRCPHMGCALKWNPAEHSWDCPCHGSRFSQDGALLENPATGNLRSR